MDRDPEQQRYLARQLHCAALRYCMEWHSHWCDVYAQTPHKGGIPYGYTDREYDVFPRYNMLKALLTSVESLAPESLGDLRSTRARLESIGESANDPFTENDMNAIERNAKDEERAKFCEHIAGLTEEDLLGIEGLPYRRVLGERESEALANRLRQKWGADFPWFPLAGSQPESGEAFQASHFHEGIDIRSLRAMIRGLGAERLWQLREGGDGYELDLELFHPRYDGMEGFWFADELDWLIYASHESSVTIAGKSLRGAVEEAWPDWREHVWMAP